MKIRYRESLTKYFFCISRRVKTKSTKPTMLSTGNPKNHGATAMTELETTLSKILLGGAI